MNEYILWLLIVSNAILAIALLVAGKLYRDKYKESLDHQKEINRLVEDFKNYKNEQGR